jgi:hypothetical protein
MTTYYAVRHIKDQTFWHPYGTSATPNLYLTPGKAEARRKQLWHSDEYEVVEVTLTIKE